MEKDDGAAAAAGDGKEEQGIDSAEEEQDDADEELDSNVLVDVVVIGAAAHNAGTAADAIRGGRDSRGAQRRCFDDQIHTIDLRVHKLIVDKSHINAQREAKRNENG